MEKTLVPKCSFRILQLTMAFLRARIKDIKVAKDRIVCQAGYLHGLANASAIFVWVVKEKGHWDDIQEMYGI